MRPSSFIRLSAAAAAAWGVFATIQYYRLGLALAHYDARAHLVVARRVFDSLIPGWQQVGAVWLPLPHLLNALPVQNDWLYRTGFSGIALSIAAMAVAVWAIGTLIHQATGSITGGAVAGALLMLNPDVLYLQSTPMTEPLLFATTFLAVALIAQWTSRVAASGSQLPASGLRVSTPAGWACVAAVLTRYEAWPIVGAAIMLAGAVLVRRGLSIPAAARAVRGLALWPMWAIAAFLVNSKITVGSWFVSSGFFVAENPALGHPWLAWTQIWEGLIRLTGPALPWIAVVSGIGCVAYGFLTTGALAKVVSRALHRPFCNLPPAFVNQPIHKCANGIRLRSIDRSISDSLFTVWLGDGEHHHRRLFRQVGPEWFERNVISLR